MTTFSKTRSAWLAAISATVTLSMAGCSKQQADAKGGAKPSAAAPSAAKPSSQPAANPAGAVPDGAKVFFVSPKPGAKVTALVKDGLVPVKVQMGLEGMKLRPAGEIVAGTGHHHILIDTDLTKIGMPVKKDAQHIHFGKGQSEAEIFLSPGKHKLSLQFANGAHLSYGPQMSASIEITVEAAPAPAQGDKPASADVPVAKKPTPPEKPPEPDPNAKK